MDPPPPAPIGTEPTYRGAASKPVNQTSPGASQSWEAIQDHMKHHDTTFVNDCSDDINNILVFAGLFSAVLTAFIAISNTMLQPDSSRPVTSRLDRISGQLDSFTTSPGYINATSHSTLAVDHFTPSPSARCINILWFLSLVFSLAAALFGILAKQWLRAYMQWDDALSSPRENVLVRQIRFDAWNRWHVFGMISSIPALLELALVMFLVGLLIFLWDIDPVVAAVITIAVGIFLAVALALLVAPVVRKRCPYRSPTAWVVLILWEMTKKLFESIQTWSIHRDIGKLEGMSSVSLWRLRDIEGNRTDGLLGGARQALLAAFRQAEINIDRKPNENISDNSDEIVALRDAPPQDQLPEIVDSTTLFHALSWVSAASQTTAVQRQVSQCATTLLRQNADEKSHLASLWYFMMRYRQAAPQYSPPVSTEPVDLSTILQARIKIWDGYQITVTTDDLSGLNPRRVGILQPSLTRSHFPSSTLPSTNPHRIISGDDWSKFDLNIFLGALAQTIASLMQVPLGHNSIEDDPEDAGSFVERQTGGSRVTELALEHRRGTVKEWEERHRRIVELLCLLQRLHISSSALEGSDVQPHVQLLVDTFNSVYCHPHRLALLDEAYPGLRTTFFQILHTLQALEIYDLGATLMIVDDKTSRSSKMTQSNLERLVQELPAISNEEEKSHNDTVHRVATILGELFVECVRSLATERSRKEELCCIIAQMTNLIKHCLRHAIRDCGSFCGTIPWLGELDALGDSGLRHKVSIPHTQFISLMQELYTYLHHGLATRPEDLRQTLRRFYTPGDGYLPAHVLAAPDSDLSLSRQMKSENDERHAYVWRIEDWLGSLSEDSPDIAQTIVDITSIVVSIDAPLDNPNNIMFGRAICFPWFSSIQASQGRVRDIIRMHAREEFLGLVSTLIEVEKNEAKRREGTDCNIANKELRSLYHQFDLPPSDYFDYLLETDDFDDRQNQLKENNSDLIRRARQRKSLIEQQFSQVRFLGHLLRRPEDERTQTKDVEEASAVDDLQKARAPRYAEEDKGKSIARPVRGKAVRTMVLLGPHAWPDSSDGMEREFQDIIRSVVSRAVKTQLIGIERAAGHTDIIVTWKTRNAASNFVRQWRAREVGYFDEMHAEHLVSEGT